jgi:phosphohistidine phosphatase SixA
MIVFALRHADRTSGDDLSPAGARRAKLLARMLAESNVSVAIRSQFIRAVKTLQPLERRLPASLQVKELRLENTEKPDDYAKKVAVAIRGLPPNAVVAAIGHSDTVGPTIEQLGGGRIDPIGDGEFDKLFIVFIAPLGPRLEPMAAGDENGAPWGARRRPFGGDDSLRLAPDLRDALNDSAGGVLVYRTHSFFWHDDVVDADFEDRYLGRVRGAVG